MIELLRSTFAVLPFAFFEFLEDSATPAAVAGPFSRNFEPVARSARPLAA